MNSNIKNTFLQACTAVGSAFNREAKIDSRFGAAFEADRESWMKITRGLILCTFFHLIEEEYGDRAQFSQKLKTTGYDDALKLLAYARNYFVHCNWKVSNLDYENQQRFIRRFAGTRSAPHVLLDTQTEVFIENDILNIGDPAPMCRALLGDV